MFSHTLLDKNQGRYTLIAEACLPPLIFWVLGWFVWKNTSKELPRPSGILFMLLWVLVIAAWTIALVLSAMDEISVVTVSLVGSFSVVALLCCLMFMTTCRNHKDSATKSLMVAALCMTMATVASLSGDPATERDSVTTSSILYAFVAAMLGTSLMMSHVYLH